MIYIFYYFILVPSVVKISRVKNKRSKQRLEWLGLKLCLGGQVKVSEKAIIIIIIITIIIIIIIIIMLLLLSLLLLLLFYFRYLFIVRFLSLHRQ